LRIEYKGQARVEGGFRFLKDPLFFVSSLFVKKPSWVFQLLEGIHRVRVRRQEQVHDLIEGLNDVQITVLRLFGEQVCCLYQISPG
jgi:hypothetical protein